MCGKKYTECWELEPFHDTISKKKRFHEPEMRECCGKLRGKDAKPEKDEVIAYETLFLVGVR